MNNFFSKNLIGTFIINAIAIPIINGVANELILITTFPIISRLSNVHMSIMAKVIKINAFFICFDFIFIFASFIIAIPK